MRTLFLLILLGYGSLKTAALAVENPSAKTPPQLNFQSAQQCRACHLEIYNEWAESWMSKAYSNPVFQQDFSRWRQYALRQGEDPTSCLRCHAPVSLLIGDTQVKKAVSREGVTCTICHKVALVRERKGQHFLVMDPRQILYGSNQHGLASKRSIAAHEIRFSKALSDSTLCAGCHLDVLANGIPLENTYREWQNSHYSKNKIQCVDCHMPALQNIEKSTAKTSHRSHRFEGGHSSSKMLKAAASLQILSIDKTGQLAIKVSNLKVGHNFPTGGAHPAKLTLSIQLSSQKGELLHSDSRVFEFIFLNKQGKQVNGREAVESWQDTGLKPLESRTERFALPSVSANTILRATLTYSLIPASIAKELSDDMYQQHYKPVLIDEVQKLFKDVLINSIIRGEPFDFAQDER